VVAEAEELLNDGQRPTHSQQRVARRTITTKTTTMTKAVAKSFNVGGLVKRPRDGETVVASSLVRDVHLDEAAGSRRLHYFGDFN
jgi:hypothetical protein